MIAASILAGLLALGTVSAADQPRPAKGAAPIYQVTVVNRTTSAVNYQYRSGPTRIDFRGTVLLPEARGEAIVESHRGSTQIDARFEKVPPPSRFGAEYLTYVLWAITPEGRPHSLGEIIPNGANKARLRVTTSLQSFGLIVTAEPYAAVRLPSDVVVMENQVRAETLGKIEPIQARYELMPRGHYTWHVPNNLASENSQGPKLSMAKYEAQLQVYQAQNALGIATEADAPRYAPNTVAKAEQLLEQARLSQARRDTRRAVELAREAAQTAEDARALAEYRKQDEKLSAAASQVNAAEQAKAKSDEEAQRARWQAESARIQTDAEREARRRAEAEAVQARQRAAEAEARAVQLQTAAESGARAGLGAQRRDEAAARTRLRVRLLEAWNSAGNVRDTPRGLVVTLRDEAFAGSTLRPDAAQPVDEVSRALTEHPGLKVEVEGHSDSPATAELYARRADSVRNRLLTGGLTGTAVTARGLGDTAPLGSNATATNRALNRRVEIVVSGDPIGNLAFWDHTYSLTGR
jgi:flagellar motor protein MotB